MALRSLVAISLWVAATSAPTQASPTVAVGDVEPNDTLKTATATGVIDVGTAIVGDGVIGNGVLGDSDRDLYAIEVSGDVDVPLLLTVGMEAADVTFDGYLLVFDAIGAEIARHDDVGYPNLNPLLHTYLLEPGMYYVGVSHALNPGYDPTDSTTGRPAPTGNYQLAIVLSSAASLADSLEPVDDTPIEVNSAHYAVRNQFIGDGPNHRLDVDRYTVQFDGPSILTVEVRPGVARALDPFLSVDLKRIRSALDGASRLGSNDRGGRNGRTGNPTAVEVDPEFFQSPKPPGRHTGDAYSNLSIGFTETYVPQETMRLDLRRQRIEMAVFDGDTDPPTMEIVVRGSVPNLPWLATRYGTVGFYDLDIDVVPVPSGGGPLEPNDSLLEATPIGLTGVGQVTFSSVYVGDGEFGAFRGDVDFFDVVAQPQQVLEVDVVPGPGDLEPVVHLFNFFGQRVATWYADASGSVHGTHEIRCADLAFPLSDYPNDEEKIGIAIMGARDRLTADVLVPNPGPPGAVLAPLPPLDRRELDDGPGSIGTYDVTFTISPSELPSCGAEPDDSIGDLTTPVLVDKGEYICGSGMLGDGSCSLSGDNVDLIKVQLDSPPAALHVSLDAYVCGDVRVLRVFDGDGNELASTGDDPRVGFDIQLELETAGAYYIGVSADRNVDYDPSVRCSGRGYFGFRMLDLYELEIHLVSKKPPTIAGSNTADTANATQLEPRLFATIVDFQADTIAELDPSTGETVRHLPAPEVPLGGSESIAVQGDNLLFLGRSGRYPFLYELDADTGEGLDRVTTWFGSGIYGGMTQRAGSLYIVDIMEDVIHVVSSDLLGPVKQVDVGAQAGVSMFGPVTIMTEPDRLVVVDAADPSTLHEFDTATGNFVTSTSLGSPCPCDADVDGDGDVDGDDVAWFDTCDAVSGVPFGCRAADLNCDGDINEADADIITCLKGGSGQPPGEDCCPEDSTTVSIRATSLSTSNPLVYVTGDWTNAELHRFSRTGDWLGSVPVDAPVGALAAKPSPLNGDGDLDGDLDLIDWGILQACFAGDGDTLANPPCSAFDFDLNGDIDLTDYDLFQEALTEFLP